MVELEAAERKTGLLHGPPKVPGNVQYGVWRFKAKCHNLHAISSALYHFSLVTTDSLWVGGSCGSEVVVGRL